MVRSEHGNTRSDLNPRPYPEVLQLGPGRRLSFNPAAMLRGGEHVKSKEAQTHCFPAAASQFANIDCICLGKIQ